MSQKRRQAAATKPAWIAISERRPVVRKTGKNKQLPRRIGILSTYVLSMSHRFLTASNPRNVKPGAEQASVYNIVHTIGDGSRHGGYIVQHRE